MKYSVLGFNQLKVIELQKEKDGKNRKLDVTDLLILRNIADFMNRSKIIKYTVDDKVYFSIQYATIIEDLPIINIKQQALSDRIDKMVFLNVLEKIVIKNQSGTFVAFRMGKKYEDLLYDCTSSETIPTSSVLHLQKYSTTSHNTNITNNTSTIKEKEDNKLSSKKKVVVNAWRSNFETYKSLVEVAKEELLNDSDFKAKFLAMYPNADYYRSVLKSMDYWCSEMGWSTKKKSKSRDINMLSTLKKNLDKSVVYKNYKDEPIENLMKLSIEYSDKKEGTLADGTVIKGAYRYYWSQKDSRTYSIPIDAPPMPNDRCEFNIKTNSWIMPKEIEDLFDNIW